MLLGVTAVTAKDAKVEIGKDAAEAARLLAAAKKLTAQVDRHKAMDILRKAIALDPNLADAYPTLAALLEQSNDMAAAMEVYRKWAAIGATTPLPYNRIGEILEKRNDFEGALEAYTQSLRVEFNQPVIMEAKKRPESKLSK